jgi:hypothetical protein
MAGRASAKHNEGGEVVSLGGDTYSITREAGSAFNRDVDKLKAEASEDAAKYCADQGKQLKVVSLTGNLPKFGLGYAKAKIVFKALNAGDPGLASEPAASPASVAAPAPAPVAAPAWVAPAEKSLSTDELYGDLVKLDDLRKKGILTDDEFQSEKRKVLSRSK